MNRRKCAYSGIIIGIPILILSMFPYIIVTSRLVNIVTYYDSLFDASCKLGDVTKTLKDGEYFYQLTIWATYDHNTYDFCLKYTSQSNIIDPKYSQSEC